MSLPTKDCDQVFTVHYDDEYSMPEWWDNFCGKQDQWIYKVIVWIPPIDTNHVEDEYHTDGH